MIFYLITSTLCMGLLLLFYRLVLEKEKMLHINRGFLLFSLLFSLIIPIVPVGIADQVPGWIQQQFDVQNSITQPHSTGVEYLPPGAEYVTPTEAEGLNRSSSFSWPMLLLAVYVMISTLLAARLLRVIHMIQPKSRTRSILKTVCLIPLFTAFAILFGCEATTPDMQTNDNEIHIAFTDSELIVVNDESMAVSEFEAMLNSLPEGPDYQFVIEQHPDMLTGPVMNVNRIIHNFQLEDGYQPNYIAVIEIDDAGNIRLDGEEVLKDDLERALIEITADHQPIINFRVHRGSDFQLIRDVQDLLRKSGALRINYFSIRSQSH
ncbi:MAG: hypothetical protein JJU13_18340 [Balneolaceae bacterium]|nr:hypothetical protein [Balneolaceae bacterium]